ncbi:hypothetical protein CsSME_00006456 [Camellia sinensis var. sinensis]
MAFVQSANVNSTILCKKGVISQVGILSIPFSLPRATTIQGFLRENVDSQSLSTKETTLFPRKRFYNFISKKVILTTPRSSSPSNSNGSKDESSDQATTPFGYTRKDVLLIGLGVTLAGIGLKSGLEKRLEGLTEAELEALLEQVEEEKRRLASGEQIN